MNCGLPPLWMLSMNCAPCQGDPYYDFWYMHYLLCDKFITDWDINKN